MPFSSARLPAAGAAAFAAAAAIAGIPHMTDAQAAQPFRPAVVQRAPVVRGPPARFVAPQVHFNANRPVHSAPTFTQHQNYNRNFRAGNPNLQRVNPNAQIHNQNLRQAIPNVQKATPNLAQPKGGLPLQGATTLKLGPGKPNFSPVMLKPGLGGKPGFPVVNVNNKFWPILKGPKFMWVGGYKKFFVPVGLLGVALIGGSYWYPDGYVSIAGPACTGFTPDGCQLQWRMVDFEDGGAEPQCVQYCPQVGPPPAQAAPLPPPLAFAANGVCQLTIFAEPNFSGISAPTGDSQPTLSQAGWQNEISSIQVQSGTWDFFSEENFGGESLRLSSGPYPMLAPEWNRRIGSFMCVQPGV